MSVFLKHCMLLFMGLTLSAATPNPPVDSVLLHPVLRGYTSCVEHWAGQLTGLGDALGVDCMLLQFETLPGTDDRDQRTWLRAHAGDGLENSDWYSWQQPVLSPISGRVKQIHVNQTVNQPGIMGSGPAGFVVLLRADGLHVLVAHLDPIAVAVGEQVEAGQVLGRVGNNGFSRHPHLHIGAWKDNTPLQIRFDQQTQAALMSAPVESSVPHN